MIFAIMVEGASHPKGSKSFADSESIMRLVTLLVSGVLTLKKNVSEIGIHWIPYVFTTLSRSKSSDTDFSLHSSGMCSKSSGELVIHFLRLNPPLLSILHKLF